ncbi:MAG: hypothetical protein IPO37_23810 [Saprospiraceae bacterium]|nr:hypothetical protein [Saprospiraceae bacterium]
MKVCLPLNHCWSTKKCNIFTNNIFKGSMVESGYCKAIVTSVGNIASMSKISKSLENIINEKTPLQQQIGSFTRTSW